MRTHLPINVFAIIWMAIIATGCNTGTKGNSENPISYDSILVEKTYHLLENPDNPNCNLDIKFTRAQT